MIPELRREYNERFTEAHYRRFLERLDHRLRRPVTFRVSETPCFVPKRLQEQCEEAAISLAMQAHAPDYLRASDATLRPEYTVAGQPERSLFITVDFAVTRAADGSLEPKLIEMQGFPSLMGFQLLLAELTQEHFALPHTLSYLNGGVGSRAEYLALLHRAIIGGEDPENVALLELDPWNQKTCPDFSAMEELLGLAVVDIRAVRVFDRVPHYERNGRWVPIRRIFNRTIVDELQRKNVAIPFQWSDQLDVSWAGHPNWYFRISKFVLPYLDHPTVPRARFLHEVDPLPEDLDRYVLKPLYSFAGVGVVVGPSREEIERIPVGDRHNWLLQERITYADALETPEGGTRVELRYMLIWPEGEPRPRPANGLVRMGRGSLMGVDFNSSARWIGASCNFFEA